MNFAVNLELPVRVRPDHPMTDEELMRFCAANGVSAVYGEGPVGGFVLEMARIWG